MTSTSASNEYLLNRDADESKLLNHQHEIITRNVGYCLHPYLLNRLPRHGARIADIATGTAIFLTTLHDIMTIPTKGEEKSKWSSPELHGFDISDEQFPAANTLSDAYHLHVHDTRQQFESKWEEYFDVVHIRYITLGLEAKDWPRVCSNIAKLLKPGTGRIMWWEYDMPKSWLQPYRGKSPSFDEDSIDNQLLGYEGLRQGGAAYVDLYGERLIGFRLLEDELKKAGLVDVIQECISLDRIHTDREAMTYISLNRWQGGMQAALKAGKEVVPGEGPITQKWIDDTYDKMIQDVKRGAYIREDQYIFFARRPGSDESASKS